MSYIPQAVSDAKYVDAAGDTMTGRITGPGPIINPTDPAGAVYNGTIWIDNSIARGALRDLNTAGYKRLAVADPSASEDAVTKNWFEARLPSGLIVRAGIMTWTGTGGGAFNRNLNADGISVVHGISMVAWGVLGVWLGGVANGTASTFTVYFYGLSGGWNVTGAYNFGTIIVGS